MPSYEYSSFHVKILNLDVVTIFPYLIFSTYLISSYLSASLIYLPKISTSYDFSLCVHLACFARLTHVLHDLYSDFDSVVLKDAEPCT